MDTTQLDKFKELWNDFASGFRGKLISESSRGTLKYSDVKLDLAEAAESWNSEYSIPGRWLYKLIADDPKRGELVRDILTNDLTVSEVAANGHNVEWVNVAAPAGLGAVGYTVAAIAHWGTVATLCSTIIPAVVAFPVAKAFTSAHNNKANDRLVEAYMEQLDKCRDAVEAALKA